MSCKNVLVVCQFEYFCAKIKKSSILCKLAQRRLFIKSN